MKRSDWIRYAGLLAVGAFVGQFFACTADQAAQVTAATSTITAFGVLFLVDRVLRG